MHVLYTLGLVWLRRDLRWQDNAALFHALKQCQHVFVGFVFDPSILAPLTEPSGGRDRRVEFIRDCLIDLNADLQRISQGKAQLLVAHADPLEAIPAMAHALGVQAVFANRDYEPCAITRDAQVRVQLAQAGVNFHDFKDQVIFEHNEVLTRQGGFYGVYTPYKNAWLMKLALRNGPFYLSSYPVERYADRLAEVPPGALGQFQLPSMADLGFTATNYQALGIRPGSKAAHALLDDFLQRIGRYGDARDFPATKGPSYLSVHLRFGTVSIRELARLAWHLHLEGNLGATVWLSELIWRDFYFQILVNHPHVVERSFKPAFDAIVWEQGEHAHALFDAWCKGETGYPLVDAAMRQLNETGYMHNRLRMVTASFLVKDLGLDWRWGEAYFARMLNDFDLAANNGGWQWAASCGCDAQPWFRIFNPVTQSQKFDPQGKFIRRYLPQLSDLSAKDIHAPWLASAHRLETAGVALGRNYPMPLVDHAQARQKTLQRYSILKPSTC